MGGEEKEKMTHHPFNPKEHLEKLLNKKLLMPRIYSFEEVRKIIDELLQKIHDNQRSAILLDDFLKKDLYKLVERYFEKIRQVVVLEEKNWK